MGWRRKTFSDAGPNGPLALCWKGTGVLGSAPPPPHATDGAAGSRQAPAFSIVCLGGALRVSSGEEEHGLEGRLRQVKLLELVGAVKRFPLF